MIVALVTETCELIQETDARIENKKEVGNIGETRDMLIELKTSTSQLMAGVQLLSARLSEQKIEEISKIGKVCVERIGRSRENFERDHRQKPELQNIQKRMQNALDSLGEAWTSYVGECTREPLALYGLVKQLPEVRRQSVTYGELQQKLKTCGNRQPASVAKLQEFDRALEQLKQMLREIANLSDEVRLFLIQLSNGPVSLADVTDEVMAWCREQEHAQVFTLQYKN